MKRQLILLIISMLFLVSCGEEIKDGFTVTPNTVVAFSESEKTLFNSWADEITLSLGNNYVQSNLVKDKNLLIVNFKSTVSTPKIISIEIKKENELYSATIIKDSKAEILKKSTLNQLLLVIKIASDSQPAPSTENIALNKPVFTSSNEGGDLNRGKSAVDGDNFSRWSSDRNIEYPHSLIVDLENQNSLKRVVINIAGFDKHKQTFKIYVSKDKINWVVIGSETENTGIFEYKIESGESYRYIKFESTYSADNNQSNLYELEAYNTEKL